MPNEIAADEIDNLNITWDIYTKELLEVLHTQNMLNYSNLDIIASHNTSRPNGQYSFNNECMLLTLQKSGLLNQNNFNTVFRNTPNILVALYIVGLFSKAGLLNQEKFEYIMANCTPSSIKEIKLKTALKIYYTKQYYSVTATSRTNCVNAIYWMLNYFEMNSPECIATINNLFDEVDYFDGVEQFILETLQAQEQERKNIKRFAYENIMNLSQVSKSKFPADLYNETLINILQLATNGGQPPFNEAVFSRCIADGIHGAHKKIDQIRESRSVFSPLMSCLNRKSTEQMATDKWLAEHSATHDNPKNSLAVVSYRPR